jgi:pSer/pThr/pTyr-binding forkhead associated (FHA) protein
MATCKTCGRENQDLYKFCLGCGAELNAAEVTAGDTFQDAPPLAHAKDPQPDPPPSGNGEADDDYAMRDRRDSLAHLQPVPGLAPSLQDVAASSKPSSARLCPSCGNVVPTEFTFCGQCGERLDGKHVSTARNVLQPTSSSAATAEGRLILIRPDGTEGGVHQLHDGENAIGRGLGPLFDADGYLSPHHAELVLNAAGLVVRDTGSLNGVFVKISDEEQLSDGDIFRIGQELLRFDEIPAPVPLDDGTDVMGSPNPGYWGRLALIVGRNQDGSAFPLFGDSVTLGRERGDILFPEDGYVSGQHARVQLRDDKFWLADLNSSNGTFLRVRGERALKPGASILMGQQLFRISY